MPVSDAPDDARSGSRWDPMVVRLRALRLSSGDPSYAEIAQRVSDLRRGRGADEHAAKIARSTVYDAFRLGRSRLSVPLVREIVEVLDGDPTLVDGWLADLGRTTDPTPPARPSTSTGSRGAPAPPASPRLVASLLAGFLAINLLGRICVDTFALPMYLDMIGTAAAAVILGPWRGVLVGALTSIVGVAISGPASLAFLHVEVVGALIWGYGARSVLFNRSIPRYFSLSMLVGLAVSVLAIPVLYLFFPEGTASGASDTILRMEEIFGSRAAATIIGNVVTNQLDKLVSGFAALALLAVVPLAIRARSPLAPLLPVDD